MSTDMQRHVITVDNGDADEPLSTRQMNPLFSSILEARLGRRLILKGSAGAAAIGFMSLGLAGCISGSDDDDDEPELAPGEEPPAALLGFSAVPVSSEDKITVPEGYSHQVLIPWGTSLVDGNTSFNIASSGAEQAEQVGSHHDGMHFFPIDGSSEDGLLVLNHEYVEPRLMHAAYAGQELSSGAVLLSSELTRVDDEVLKEMNAHGVTVVRVVRDLNGEWQVQPDGYNRRITALTPMLLSGPVAGSDLVKTKYSIDGTETRGTINNCGSGVTPWNTYMAAEENWAGYFVNEGTYPREHERYGVPKPGTDKDGNPTRAKGKYEWHRAESGADEYVRFNATDSGATVLDDYRNEPNTFGWMVEIDPFDPQSTPVKRTAMGRFAHEAVVFAPVVEGKPVVCYSGDDSRFEYIYKFVSRDPYYQASAAGELLDNGTLYVARFNDDGSGEWLPLVYGENGLDESTEFTSQADVLVNTRLAADLMGATPMDRPEWGAIDPANGDVYFTLTNNSKREEGDTDEANPRAPNTHGHIIRWTEADGDHAATSFQWDIFMFAGDSGESGKPMNIGYDPNGEKLTADNILSSPDGMWIDPDSRVWIQMDSGDTDPFGNCAMLVADPNTGELKRFLVGPLGQEITGIIMTPDQRTLFINVQHPGANNTSAEDFAAGAYGSSWPDGNAPAIPPRSATVVIWKDDGGIVGT
ncbi:PhoX family protein [Pseudomonas saliphila]|uniref:PhoX family protein n=1 Tax=Pseudomonas saliphila TaxID=2586906 RepID=UPI0019D5D0C6|nr:PhoX family phosphatase [Pseudomonas saliphila]